MFIKKTSIPELNTAKLGEEFLILAGWYRDNAPECMQEFAIHDAVQAEKSINICWEHYDYLLLFLSNLLNSYHKIEKNISYYETIIGPWLLYFVHQMYEKYITVKAVIGGNVNHRSCYISSSQWVVPVDFEEYKNLVTTNDLYVEQQYSQVMRHLNVHGEDKVIEEPLQQNNIILIKKTRMIHVLAQKFTIFMQKLLNRKHVIVAGGYSNKEFYKLSLLSGFRFAVYDFENTDINVNVSIDWGFRNTVLECDSVEDFDVLLVKTVLFNIPSIFIEGFSSIRSKALKNAIFPETLISAVGLSGYMPALQFILAENSTETNRVLFQHGGCYGTDCVHALEYLERKLSNKYISWGWGDKERDIYSLPSPILEPYRKLSKKSIQDSGILLTMPAIPRYLVRLHQQLSYATLRGSFLPDVVDFIHSLDGSFKDSMYIRSHPSNYGVDLYNKLSSIFDGIQHDDRSSKFYESIMKRRICVFGHIATTYIQSMVANRPTVIFLDRKIYCHRDEAIYYFNELERVGILFYSSIDAANHINNIYANVEEWWLSEDVQDVKNKFLLKYGSSSSDWMKQWTNTLL